MELSCDGPYVGKRRTMVMGKSKVFTAIWQKKVLDTLEKEYGDIGDSLWSSFKGDGSAYPYSSEELVWIKVS
jgi:hypothetical protein